MKKHILIVEDDENVSEGLQDVLGGYGYEVICCTNSRSTMEILEKTETHLIILDVHLGKENGYELCRKIRKKSDIPILFLTGCSSELELIRGFQAGGDDYVTKPFRMQELLVRIQALMRRCVLKNNLYYQSGDLIYDRYNYQLIKKNCPVALTLTETKLITVLLENWPCTLNRKDLLYKVWDKDAEFVEENTLSVNISRLREKLGFFENVPYILTIRGIGYRWAIPVQEK